MDFRDQGHGPEVRHTESVSIPVSICTANQIVILFTLPHSFFIINVFFLEARWERGGRTTLLCLCVQLVES